MGSRYLNKFYLFTALLGFVAVAVNVDFFRAFPRAQLEEWAQLIDAPFAEDKPYVLESEYMQAALFSVRTVKQDKFYLVMNNHVSDPPLYDMALPKLSVETEFLLQEPTAVPRMFTVGPQPQARALETSHVYAERWLRMLLALVCWVGVTAYVFPRQKLGLAFRILWGVFISGWGLWLLSWVFHRPLRDLYYVWVPLALVGFVFLGIRVLRERGRNILQRDAWQLGVLFLVIPQLWGAFLLKPLSGPDARAVWFYRYKFEYLLGFIPEFIAKYMYHHAQRDYSWFLGGPLGIASWLDTRSYGGWYENAVYGSLLWLLVALLLLWWRFTAGLSWFVRVCTVFMTFVPLAVYINNGYMDGFWIPLFGLFLVGFFTKTWQRRELWILLAVACSLKNEAVACFVVLSTVALLWRRMPVWDVFVGFAALLFPLGQKWLLQAWGMYDQYHLGQRLRELKPYDALKRWESAHRFLIKDVFIKNPKYVLPLLLLLVLAFLQRRLKEAGRFVVLVYALTIPMMFIYTYTPHDQDWQLITSGYRVFMLYPFFTTLALVGFLQRKCGFHRESAPESHGHNPDGSVI